MDRFDLILHFESLRITNPGHLSNMFGPMLKDFMTNPGFRSFWQAEHLYFSPIMKDWVSKNCPEIDGLRESGYLANIVKDGEDAA